MIYFCGGINISCAMAANNKQYNAFYRQHAFLRQNSVLEFSLKREPIIMLDARVTLLGGTGFVGSQLTYHLSQHFSEVVLLTRRSQRSRHLKILSNVQVQETDVHDSLALEAALQGTDIVINLVGILNSSGASGNSFADAHTELTRKVVDTCGKLGITRYLHMSALHADAQNGTSEYLKSKGKAEDIVRGSSELNWTMFQPSVIFGEKDAFLNRFAGLLEIMPIFPLACPDAKMAPVYVGDVVGSMLNATTDSSTHGATICLCGPQDYTLEELVKYTATTAGLNRKVIGLPDFLSRLQARIMEWVPGKPFSMDNYLSLQTDSVCADNCERQPTSLQAVAPRYLGKGGGISGRYQTHRRMARR